MREVKASRQSVSKLSVIFKHWLSMNSSTPLLRVSLINYRSQFVRNLKYRRIVEFLYSASSTLHGLLTHQIYYFHQIMCILVPFILEINLCMCSITKGFVIGGFTSAKSIMFLRRSFCNLCIVSD
jgi:hypothetical protein